MKALELLAAGGVRADKLITFYPIEHTRQGLHDIRDGKVLKAVVLPNPARTTMIGIHEDLARRAEERRPILFAVVGAGQMGTDIVSQVQQMRGIRVAASCRPGRRPRDRCLRDRRCPSRNGSGSANAGAANDAVRAGRSW